MKYALCATLLTAFAGCTGQIYLDGTGAPSVGSTPDNGSAGAGGAAPDNGSAGGAGGGIDPLPNDPFAVPSTCTSKISWTQGNEGSADMNPGLACISCHAAEPDAPKFAIAGTVYPTAHEPDLCNGAGSAAAVQVVVTGADGTTLTLIPNTVGNFSYRGALATPYKVKVVSMGRERAMGGAQTSGDCNSCHTKGGANGAPGRIVLP